MDLPISRTKIALPTPRGEWLTRPRLLELLYELLDFKLILVTAPAGYGKTTFMADMAHRIDIPTCWFALDELDQDLGRFIAHLIASIEARFPGFGEDSRRELQREGPFDLERIAAILANETYSQIRDHFLIILDDYYLVEVNPDVRQFVSLFVQRTDENCHVALLTRKLPDLPDLTLLVGRTQVAGVSFRELAFTPEEIQAFIQQNYHETIAETLAKDLFEQTEGWITGLLLSTQSYLDTKTIPGRVARATARASGINLSAYLMEQVLDHQPDYLCRFLLETSLLETFNLQFCQQVLGEPPVGHTWQELMFTLVEKNLFIQPLENGWVRYHHLFRDFLQTQCAQNDPVRFREILYILAEVYQREGEWEQSRTIYQRLDDQEAIARLVEEVSPALAAGSRYKTLANWIDALPYALRFSHPSILSLRGITAVMLGSVQDGVEFLNQAAKTFQEANQPRGLAQTLIRRGMAHLMSGHYQEAQDDAQQALVLLGKTTDLTHAEALRVIGLCLQRVGDFPAAIETLEKARMIFVFLGDQRREAVILGDLGMLYRTLGKYQQAEAAYHNALNFWRRTQHYSNAAFTANNLGVFFHLRGNYRQAAIYLEESLAYANRSEEAKGLTYASLGDLYADLKIQEAARAAYQQSRNHVSQAQNKYLLFYLDLAEAQLASLAGGESYAYALLDSARRAVAQSDSPYQNAMLELTTAQIWMKTSSEKAESALNAALAYFSERTPSNDYLLTHFFMAVVQHQLKRKEASQHLSQALEMANQLGTPQPLIVATAQYYRVIEKISVPATLTYSLHQLLQSAAAFNRELPALRRLLRKKGMTIPADPPKLVIQGLGANRVIVNGKELAGPDWQTVKARDIFFFILEHPGGVSREKIEGVFWPEATSAQLNFIFKKTMYRLRRAFETDPILFNGDRYAFDFKGDYEYDVEEWERALKQAEQTADVHEKHTAFMTAVTLYKGEFLPEVDGPWISEKREYFHRKFLEANLFLGQSFLNQGNFTKALEYCQALLSLDAGNEEAHRLAMQSHAARGNRGEVVRQYNLCVKSLKKEYGIAPSQETVQLYKTLTR